MQYIKEVFSIFEYFGALVKLIHAEFYEIDMFNAFSGCDPDKHLKFKL